MKIQAYAEVKDENGKVILRKKLKSFVIAFADILFFEMSQTQTDIKDTSGNIYTFIDDPLSFAVACAVGFDDMGIQVGSGTDIVTLLDFQLKTQILHGNGAGQLAYGSCDVSIPATFGSSRQFTISRTFTNGSGAAITVNEIGLVCECMDNTSEIRFLLIERSILQFIIANGSNKTVTYTIKITV